MYQLLKIFLYIAIPLTVGVTSFQYLHGIFFEPLDERNTTTKLVEVRSGMPLSDVCDLLVKERLIRTSQSLCLFRQLKGSTKSLIPGEYELSPAMTPEQILQKLEQGDRYLRTLHVSDGATIEQMDELFAKQGIFKRYEFDAAAHNPDLLSQAGIASESFEGYLGTGDYSFALPTTPAKIIWEMIEKAEQGWEQRFTEQLDTLRMSRHEALILASIIQKATDDPDERRLVSSVLHNRLENGMKLESFEALAYGIRDFDGTIAEADKALPSPYNTFLNYGLPPGPILSPGKDAMDAALFPKKTSHLFYGRSKSGILVFSTTQKELEALLGM